MAAFLEWAERHPGGPLEFSKRKAPMRRIPLLFLAVMALTPRLAQATSFPCASYLHNLRVGHHPGLGERPAEERLKKAQDRADRDKRRWEEAEPGSPEERSFHDRYVSDLTGIAFWRADLRYLRIIDRRIGEQDCSDFDYPGIFGWLTGLSHHFHNDRNQHTGRHAAGGSREDQIRAERRAEYDTGALTAIDVNRQSIEDIGRSRGVAFPSHRP